ncbi:WD40 repeat domain-containing protein [Flexivirga oryzae]|uniref:WD40 repeat protein n=1 Tax=Flexivirga oryzae TaxID=1794944 RepID=A0A839N578_9MICO|nr:WD40 repeat domain-containing protein [Flexivirga oryzae]MBB2891909.1 WD40 repeat protein [Flexivirga oryzae]
MNEQHGQTGAEPARALGLVAPKLPDDMPEFESLEHLLPEVTTLREVLERYGFEVDFQTVSGVAAKDAVSDVLDGAGRLRVVYVFGHAVVTTRTKELLFYGIDGAGVPVAEWMNAVERAVETNAGDGSALTLFVLDICHAGKVSELPWMTSGADEHTRAWFIAASDSEESAFDARLTKALAQALRAAEVGDLGIDPTVEFVPWVTLRDEILRIVEEAGASGIRQRVRSTLLDRTINPPFFRNPRYRPAPDSARQVVGGLDELLAEIVDSVDFGVDPAHFVERASPMMIDRRVSYFAGRSRQLRWLAERIERPDSPGMHVVTGSPGSGKSALLGMAVCAIHPVIREHTQYIAAATAERFTVAGRFAAVHARGRSVSEIAESIARQLDLGGQVSSGETLIDALTGGSTPVIVVDAVDEASDPETLVADLLEPLARGSAGSDHARAKLIVGTRSGPQWEMATSLLTTAAGNVLDLDDDPARSLEDVREFVRRVLVDTPAYEAVASQVADAVHDRLASSDDALAHGAFLVARLYLTHLRANPVLAESFRSDPRSLEIPTSLAEVIELDLAGQEDPGRARAILSALSWAKGDGMPLQQVDAIARRFLGVEWAASPSATSDLLDSDVLRFYQRRSVDTDGRTLYRLFHQGLADYLRTRPQPAEQVDERTLSGEVFDAIVRSIAGSSNRPNWRTAPAYLSRHALGHAIDAARERTVLGNVDYLVSASLPHVLDDLGVAPAPVRVCEGAELLRLAGMVGPVEGDERRVLLTLLARQNGFATIADELQRDAEAGEWSPSWASGSASRGPRQILDGHSGPVLALAAAAVPDSDTWRAVAVTGSADRTAAVWDLTSGELLHVLTGHDGPVLAVAIAVLPDGTAVVATASADGKATVWDASTGQPLRDLIGHREAVRQVHIVERPGATPLVITGGADRSVMVWDLSTGERLHRLYGHGRGSMATTTLPDGTPVVVTVGTGSVAMVWNVETGELRHRLYGHGKGAVGGGVATAWLPDGTPVAVAAGSGRSVIVWDLVTGGKLHQLQGHSRHVSAIATTYLPDRTAIAVTAGGDGRVLVWNLLTGRQLHTLTGHMSGVLAVAATALPDRTPIAVTTSRDHAVIAWDLRTGRRLLSMSDRSRSVLGVAASTLPDHTPVAVTGGDERAATVWELLSGTERRTIDGHVGSVRALAIARDDNRSLIVTGSTDRTAIVWDVATGERLHTLQGHSGSVRTVATSTLPDRTPVVVTPASGRSAAVWDLRTGERLSTLTGEKNSMRVAVTTALPDGRSIVLTAGASDTAAVWDLSTGQRLHRLGGHGGDAVPVVRIAHLHDGTPVAITVGADGVARVWDLVTGRRMHSWAGRGGGAIRLVGTTALPDQRLVAVRAGIDPDTWVWDVASGSRLHRLQGIPRPVRAVATTKLPDQTAVVLSATTDQTLTVSDAASGELIRTLTGREGRELRALTTAVLPDGSPIAIVADTNGGISVRDVSTGAERQRLALPQGPSVMVTSDRLLATAFGNDICCWELLW